MPQAVSVEILLATYNGGRFLEAQLESLLRQTFPAWRVLVRDDGSTDETAAILGRFVSRYPEKVTFVRDGLGRLGACGSFGRLLALSQAPYIMLCDQDDVWLPEKIERTLHVMREAEKAKGTTTPILVHTDLQVVDQALRVIDKSFWHYQHLRPEAGSRWQVLLVQNVVTGCTVMINRALRDMAVPVPPQAIMHDWWLALVAALFGRVLFLRWASVLYRQHCANDTGATRWSVWTALRRGMGGAARDRFEVSFTRSQMQAQALLDCFGWRMPASVRRAMTRYVALRSAPWLNRRLFLIREGILKIGLIRNVGLLLRA